MTAMSRAASATFVVLLLTLAPTAQAQDLGLPQDLTSISPAQALALNIGRLYRFTTWPDYPPLPPIVLILLKNPSGQKVTVKKTISDVSPGNSNRVQTKLARKNSRHFSRIFTHLQKRGVLQQNPYCLLTPPSGKTTLALRPMSFTPQPWRHCSGMTAKRSHCSSPPRRQ